MKAIPIHNPSRHGKDFCSPKRAAQYIARGRAVLLPDGSLQFTAQNQAIFNQRLDAEAVAFDAAVVAGRGKKVYWNGAYPDASYPPGCNVQFEPPWREPRHHHEHLSD